MNLNKLVILSAGIVLALSATMNLNQLQTWIWRAQARLIYESRTENWGSPKILRNDQSPHKLSRRDSPEGN